MPDYEDHEYVKKILAESQDDDQYNREAAREANLFINSRDGQWEPHLWQSAEGRPRYTFDKTSPVVDQIAGEMEQADFNITIHPAGGDATKDDAKLLDGIVRNIENISGANDIFNMSARGMVTTGLDGWQIKQAYIDDDSFDQDLIIEPVANFIDSVWFGPFKKPDASDCQWCVVLECVDKRTYEAKYPDGSAISLSQGRVFTTSLENNSIDKVVIGNLYYIHEKPRELLLMSDGRVLEATEAEPILDELEQAGVTVKMRRTRNKNIVYSRLFDGGGWLNKRQETVFNQIPVIPDIGNFSIVEDKVCYRGVVEKLLDPQRVYNYSTSRMIEEGALAPRAKYWMTHKQAAGHERQLSTLNKNSDPVQFYNVDPEVPGPPQQIGGAQINPGLQSISVEMTENINASAGLFDANRGNNPGLQSGVAIKALQNKGDTGTIKYFKAHERAIRRTAKILVDAIPKVYSTQRQLRIMNEDGSAETAIVNQEVYDVQTNKMVMVNDLSKGKYDVTCSAGPSFQNRQQETVSAITEISQFDPSAIQMGSDILFNNLRSPGMDLIAQRKRQQLFQAGVIPFEQMTDEEKRIFAQQQQQPPAPDPAMVLAEAEAGKAQAQANKVQVDAAIAQSKEARENALAEHEIQQSQQKFEFNVLLEELKQTRESQKDIATTLKLLREAMGVDTVVGPSNTEAYARAADEAVRSFDN
jgi:hypothetical protein